MERCPRCGRRGVVRESIAIGGRVCESCYCDLAPTPTALKPLPFTSPPRPKPSRYAKLHRRVWERLEAQGEVFPTCDGTGRLRGWCPVCGSGVIEIRLLDTDPPRVRTEGCSDGCSGELVAEVL